MYELARSAVAFAFFGSALSALSGFLAPRFGGRQWWKFSAGLAVVALAALVFATVVLAGALLRRDFRVLYVQAYTSTDLHWVYALSALWAGQAGSLLFWTVLLSLLQVVFLVASGKSQWPLRAIAHGVLGSLVCFFAGVVVQSTDPFVTRLVLPTEGAGLNPLLQNVQMLFHPPTLYLGYLLFAVPFALVFAGLVTGASAGDVLRQARPWIVAGWACLTLGILLGMQWAYVELGWGGYWAWDPVENASLIPWLSATALLHVLALIRRQRLQPAWGVGLVFVTFCLCLLGALLARGGLVTSVHAFARSPLAVPLLVATVVAAGSSALLTGVRRRALTADVLQPLGTRDWLLALTAAALGGFCLAVLLWTWWPVLSAVGKAGAAPSQYVTRDFYDALALPVAVMLVAFLWACLGARSRVAKPWLVPWLAAGTLLPAGILAWLYLRREPPGSAWTGAAAAVVVTLAGGAAIVCVVQLVKALTRAGGGRRWRESAQLVVHLGLAITFVAVALSEAFSRNEQATLEAGASARVLGLTLQLERSELKEEPGYEALVARVKVEGPGGNPYLLTPEVRAYRGREDLSAEVALRTGLREDVLLQIAHTSREGRVTFLLYRKPAVLWLWVGGALMVLGGALGAASLREKG
jgi:cytochrome c-type biogenesis protein CcmF